MNLPSFHPSRFLKCLGAALALASGVVPVRADELMRQVQEELRRRNVYFGEVNGLKSPQVAAALRRYQQRKGFPATGEADTTTLQSLSLSTGLATALPAEASPAPTTAEVVPLIGAAGLALPWPDLPVLHSDLGRENAEPPVGIEPIDPTPTPPPKPPPAAAFHRVSPDEGNLRGFVEDFLRRGESNDPDAQLDCFAEQVDYFDDGKVTKAFIARDTARYNKRWPVRHFALAGPLQVTAMDPASPGEVVVNFRYRFDVRQAERESKLPKEVKGEADNTYTLVRTGPDGLRIVAIKEQRVRR